VSASSLNCTRKLTILPIQYKFLLQDNSRVSVYVWRKVNILGEFFWGLDSTFETELVKIISTQFINSSREVQEHQLVILLKLITDGTMQVAFSGHIRALLTRVLPFVQQEWKKELVPVLDILVVVLGLSDRKYGEGFDEENNAFINRYSATCLQELKSAIVCTHSLS
jgi:hypothetical protein